MGQSRQSGGTWTRDGVETRLVAAFCALPSHPVFSRDGRVSVAGASEAAEALNWAARFVADSHERLVLLTWARCRATGDSIRDRYRKLGWSRTSADRARARAVDCIITGLNVPGRRA